MGEKLKGLFFIKKHYAYYTAIGFLLCTFLILLNVYYHFYFPQMKLLGEEKITINYRTTYEDAGAILEKKGVRIDKEVQVVNYVNTNEIGEYKVEYFYQKGIFLSKVIRYVEVKDLEKPIIILNGRNDFYVCETYEEEGFSAIDNFDGDITDKVEREVQEDKIIYKVKDTSNNETIIERKVSVNDKTPPSMVLNGEQNISVMLGENWVDPGVTSTDNCDGDLTSKIKTTGSVNTSQVGTYEITYEVEDSSGNKSILVRKVSVLKKTVASFDGKPGVIYLTFDDGPSEGSTTQILDILKSEGVKATFFVTGSGPDYLIKRAYDEGHSIALHTYTHNYATVYSSVQNYYNDLNAVSERVKRITGVESKIIRFPGGSSNTVSRKYTPGIMSFLTQDVIAKGYRYYDWNVSSNDAGGANTTSEAYSNTVRGLSKSRVNNVLMHDVKWTTANAIRDIIRFGKNNGYTFETITMDTPMIRHSVNN